MSSQDPPQPSVDAVDHGVGDQDAPIDTSDSFGWLPAEGLPTHTQESVPARKRSTLKKRSASPSVSSADSSVERNDHTRGASLSHNASVSKRSMFTNGEGRAINGSTFINGAGTTGPNTVAEPNENMGFRAAVADVSLTPKQKSKIVKSEAKDGRRLSKIIKEEAKVEKQALNASIKELEDLQQLQKAAVKREAKMASSHAKMVAAFQKTEAAFHDMRTKYETAQAQLNAETETLEACKNHAREITEHMQEKSQEVDSLRTMFSIDEREREVKLIELSGRKK
ncbi:hypothetical protein BD779DRAFT_1433515 [Infundibulicybe gibba]|nr:hypothetical protein BD779DRAFT_1433515 [Infundibulicybe gibba]